MVIIIIAVFVIVSILVKPLQATLASGLLALTLSLLPSAILWVVTRLWGMFLARDHILVYPVSDGVAVSVVGGCRWWCW